MQHYYIKARTENLKKELLPRSILLMSLKLRVLYVNIKKITDNYTSIGYRNIPLFSVILTFLPFLSFLPLHFLKFTKGIIMLKSVNWSYKAQSVMYHSTRWITKHTQYVNTQKKWFRTTILQKWFPFPFK